MKLRMGLGLGILLFFLIAGLLAAAAMKQACDPVAQLLKRASVQDNPQIAIALAQEAKQKWDHHRDSIAALADHTPMDEIDGLFGQAITCAENGQTEDFSALCNRLSLLVSAVYDAHRLTWWNII